MSMNRQSQPNCAFRKVNVYKQTHYTYHTVTGDIDIFPSEGGQVTIINKCSDADQRRIVIEEGSITLEMLQDLHRADNNEVYHNLAQAHRPMTDVEKRQLDEWRNDPEHPERKREYLYPDNFQPWNLPIDGLRSEEDDGDALDRDQSMYRAAMAAQKTTDGIERLREFVSTLSARQQELYQLVYIDGLQLNEAALVMGVSQQRAVTLNKQLKANIAKGYRP